MVISKVDKKDKTSVVELTVGSDDFTSIFKEIKESLQQLKDSDPQDVLKLIDKESYKTIKENNSNSIIDWKIYDTDINKENRILFTKPYSSSVKNKQFDGFYIYYSLEDKQFHLATSLSGVEEKIVRFEKVLDTKTGQSDIIGFNSTKERRNQLLNKIYAKTIKQIESILSKMIYDDKYLTMAKVESGKIPVEMLSDEQIKRYFHYNRNLGELWRFKSIVSPDQWNRIILLINKF
jgi:hypothetical protein